MLAAAEDWALFLHLLGAFSFVGGAITAGIAFEAARRRRRPHEIAVLLGLARGGVVFLATGAVLVLAFGLWLVHLEGLGFATGWVDAALVLFVVALVTGGIAGQPPKRARRIAECLAEDAQETETPDLRALLDDRPARALNYLAALLTLAVLALMVFKPG